MKLDIELCNSPGPASNPWGKALRQSRPFGLLCLSVLFLAGCEQASENAPQGAPQAFERPPSPVTAATAIAQDVPLYLDEIGKCVARESVSIQPQVTGRITELKFEDGADVKTGDVLFTIDPRPYRVQVAAAMASLAQAKAVRELARTEFARVSDLVNSKSVSKSEVDVKRNAVAVSETEIQQSEAALEAAQLNVDFCTIKSPINGKAGQRLVDLGNVVSPSSGAMLVIQRLDPIYAEFTVAEQNLTAVQQNMAQGTLKVEVRLPEQPDEPRVGELTFLDNAVQETSGTVKLRATIPNTDHRFWPGRFVKVRLVLKTLAGAVLIPAAATQMSAQGPYVYVVKEDSTAELRPVTPGQRQGDLIVVEKGLAAGERVVVTGHIGVMPGGKVRIVEPEAAPSPAGTATPGAAS